LKGAWDREASAQSMCSVAQQRGGSAPPTLAFRLVLAPSSRTIPARGAGLAGGLSGPQVDNGPVEPVRDRRAGGAARFEVGPKHEVVDQELRAAPKEVFWRPLVELIVLVDPFGFGNRDRAGGLSLIVESASLQSMLSATCLRGYRGTLICAKRNAKAGRACLEFARRVQAGSTP
jgi:hypothetical protein